jgi:DNA-binding PadR family transcriptional regulator
MHGYGIVKESSDGGGEGVLDLGTLYRIIGRMIEKGLLEDVTADQDDPRKQRRYYVATELGRRVARAEAARLRELLESERGRLLWERP